MSSSEVPSPALYTSPLPSGQGPFVASGPAPLLFGFEEELPTRSTDGHLPVMPNKHYTDRQVWDELSLSVAPTPSPQPSPYRLDETPLPGAFNIQGAASPAPSANIAPSLAPSHAGEEPVDMQELEDDIILPYRDRPAEIAELFSLSSNEHIYTLLRDSLLSTPTTKGETPAEWSWDRFDQHLKSTREEVNDSKWIEDARICLEARGENLWSRFRDIIGIDIVPATSRVVLFDVEPFLEGDALVGSSKANEEVQRRAAYSPLPPAGSPSSSPRHHARTRSIGSVSRRSMISMSAIDEAESESDEAASANVSPLPPSIRSGSVGEPPMSPTSRAQRGLRFTAGPRTTSRSLSMSTAKDEVASISSEMDRVCDTFSDDFALASDEDDYTHPRRALSPYGPPASSNAFDASSGPALPDLTTILTSGIEAAAVATASRRASSSAATDQKRPSTPSLIAAAS